MSRSLVRSLVFALACLALLLGQTSGAGAAAGTLDRQLEDDDFVAAVETVAAEIDDFLVRAYDGTRLDYEGADVVVFARKTKTPCGTLRTGGGSSYCSENSTVYLDVESLEEIVEEYGANPAVVEITRQYAFHVMALVGEIDDEADADPAAAEQLVADCLTGLWIAVAEYAQLMPPGATGEIVAYLAAATDESDEAEQPGALRVERFLSGYYLQTCS
jgi:predicted metalloprotease